jgi:hypothetical protein
MQASDLSPAIWNAIADEIRRQTSEREIYFVKVTKSDTKRHVIWCQDFGSMAIPLVGHAYGFDYYDTSGTDVMKKTGTVEVVCPRVGQTVVILDPWGAKRFPICIGVILSKSEHSLWEET